MPDYIGEVTSPLVSSGIGIMVSEASTVEYHILMDLSQN